MKKQLNFLSHFGIIIVAGLFFLSACHNIQQTQTASEEYRQVEIVVEEVNEDVDPIPDATVQDLLP